MGTLLNISSTKVTKYNDLQKNGNVNTNKSETNLNFDFSNPKKEIIELSIIWKNLSEKYEGLDASAFLVLLDENKFAQFYPEKILPSASTIKIPILLLALEMLDEGTLLLNENIKLEKDLIGGGAGWMAYEKIGTYFPVHELATEMIRISDNTAANLLIKRLGGIKEINRKLKEIGLESTRINNLLPDLQGTNTTSTKDLAYLIALVDSGNLLGIRTRDLFREILSTSTNNKLIPKGILTGLQENDKNIDYKLLIKGYRVYNKTGDIGISYADTALIQMPDNSRAVASFIVKGPFNDPRSSELIRQMSEAIIEVIEPKTLLNQ
tara:strand:- start:513 stop:1481 length:969 start_codon:yes stop_codon:yes gene_type:complete